MTVAYFDCFSGAAGDMIVASLVDAGADAAGLKEQLASLRLTGVSISIEKINKQGFSATRFHVRLDENVPRPHRHLADVLAIIGGSGLRDAVKQRSAQVFERLAQAEAAVHGTTVDRVHFHEVGAEDAIVDIVGAVVALELLGVHRIICSPIPTGSGTVRCDHGVLPVPAPATAELLKGVPIAASDETHELTTPTGAALLTTLADGFGPVEPMTIKSIGYGAGTREGKTRPNILRVLIGQATDDAEIDEVTVVEANVDDASPELIGHCMERLFNKGALDVFVVPIQMKKSRPGVLLTVLCTRDRIAAMERVLFAETTTFGVRRHEVRRTKLSRRYEAIKTPFGTVRMKIGELDGVVTASPEFEDCREAALRHDVSLREVMAAARAAWSAGGSS